MQRGDSSSGRDINDASSIPAPILPAAAERRLHHNAANGAAPFRPNGSVAPLNQIFGSCLPDELRTCRQALGAPAVKARAASGPATTPSAAAYDVETQSASGEGGGRPTAMPPAAAPDRHLLRTLPAAQRLQLMFARFEALAAASGVQLQPGWSAEVMPDRDAMSSSLISPQGKLLRSVNDALQDVGAPTADIGRVQYVSNRQLAEAAATAAAYGLQLRLDEAAPHEPAAALAGQRRRKQQQYQEESEEAEHEASVLQSGGEHRTRLGLCQNTEPAADSDGGLNVGDNDDGGPDDAQVDSDTYKDALFHAPGTITLEKRQQLLFLQLAQAAAAAGVQLQPGWGAATYLPSNGVRRTMLISPTGQRFQSVRDAFAALKIPLHVADAIPPAPPGSMSVSARQLDEAAAAAAAHGLQLRGEIPAVPIGAAHRAPAATLRQQPPGQQAEEVAGTTAHEQRQQLLYLRLAQGAAAAGVQLQPGWAAATHFGSNGKRRIVLISPAGRRFHKIKEAFDFLNVPEAVARAVPPAPVGYARVSARQLAEAAATAAAHGLQLLSGEAPGDKPVRMRQWQRQGQQQQQQRQQQQQEQEESEEDEQEASGPQSDVARLTRFGRLQSVEPAVEPAPYTAAGTDVWIHSSQDQGGGGSKAAGAQANDGDGTFHRHDSITQQQRQQLLFLRLAQGAAAAGVQLQPGWAAATNLRSNGKRKTLLISPTGRRFQTVRKAFHCLKVPTDVADAVPPAPSSNSPVSAQQLAEAAATAAAHGLQLRGEIAAVPRRKPQDDYSLGVGIQPPEDSSSGQQQSDRETESEQPVVSPAAPECLAYTGLAPSQQLLFVFSRLAAAAQPSGGEMPRGWSVAQLRAPNSASVRWRLTSPEGRQFRSLAAAEAYLGADKATNMAGSTITPQQLADARALAERSSAVLSTEHASRAPASSSPSGGPVMEAAAKRRVRPRKRQRDDNDGSEPAGAGDAGAPLPGPALRGTAGKKQRRDTEKAGVEVVSDDERIAGAGAGAAAAAASKPRQPTGSQPARPAALNLYPWQQYEQTMRLAQLCMSSGHHPQTCSAEGRARLLAASARAAAAVRKRLQGAAGRGNEEETATGGAKGLLTLAPVLQLPPVAIASPPLFGDATGNQQAAYGKRGTEHVADAIAEGASGHKRQRREDPGDSRVGAAPPAPSAEPQPPSPPTVPQTVTQPQSPDQKLQQKTMQPSSAAPEAALQPAGAAAQLPNATATVTATAPRSDLEAWMQRLRNAVSAAGGDPAALLAGWRVKAHRQPDGSERLAYHPPGKSKAIVKRRTALKFLGLAPKPSGEGEHGGNSGKGAAATLEAVLPAAPAHEAKAGAGINSECVAAEANDETAAAARQLRQAAAETASQLAGAQQALQAAQNEAAGCRLALDTLAAADCGSGVLTSALQQTTQALQAGEEAVRRGEGEVAALREQLAAWQALLADM